jgi:hypothetical protein
LIVNDLRRRGGGVRKSLIFNDLHKVFFFLTRPVLFGGSVKFDFYADFNVVVVFIQLAKGAKVTVGTPMLAMKPGIVGGGAGASVVCHQFDKSAPMFKNFVAEFDSRSLLPFGFLLSAFFKGSFKLLDCHFFDVHNAYS